MALCSEQSMHFTCSTALKPTTDPMGRAQTSPFVVLFLFCQKCPFPEDKYEKEFGVICAEGFGELQIPTRC